MQSIAQPTQTGKTQTQNHLTENKSPCGAHEDWRVAKADAERMAISMSQCGPAYRKRAERMAGCASVVQSKSCPDGHMHKIIHAVLCRDRACPQCSRLRSRALAARTAQAVEAAGGRLLLLTLTVKSPEDGKLRQTLRKMSAAYGKMMRGSRLRGVVGGYIRTLEITRGHGGWHPHIHALLRVDESYFSRANGLYVTQQEWASMWQRAIGARYAPIVDVRAVLPHDRGGAISEVAKYTTKSADLHGLPLVLLKEWLEAVKGIRLWTAGGCLRVRDSDVEAEMIHTVDEQQTPDVCPVCGQRLQIVDWLFRRGAGYVQSLEPIAWPRSKSDIAELKRRGRARFTARQEKGLGNRAD